MQGRYSTPRLRERPPSRQPPRDSWWARAGTERTAYADPMGEAQFHRDGDLVTVVLDGQEQSAVHLGDPTRLDFEYVERFALALDVLAPAGPLRVTHVGGAGLTLPRWLQHTRPGSPQIVLEPDVALTEAVRRELPLPRGHRIRVRATDGETGVAALKDASADVIVLDAYAGGRVPADLTSVEWFGEVARVLVPGGLLLANLADEPGWRWLARAGAGAQAALGHTAYIGLHEVLKGRRFGNIVLVASTAPIDLYDLRRAVARLALPTGVLTAEEVARRVPGAQPFSRATGDLAASPPPPDRGSWRRR